MHFVDTIIVLLGYEPGPVWVQDSCYNHYTTRYYTVILKKNKSINKTVFVCTGKTTLTANF